MDKDFNKTILSIMEKKERGFAIVSSITQIDETNVEYEDSIIMNCNIKDLANILYNSMLIDKIIFRAAVYAIDRFVKYNKDKKCDEDCANCKDNYSPIRN